MFCFTFPNILYGQSLTFPHINQSLTPNLLPGHEYRERGSSVHMKSYLMAQKILASGLEQKCRISLPSIPKEFVSWVLRSVSTRKASWGQPIKFCFCKSCWEKTISHMYRLFLPDNHAMIQFVLWHCLKNMSFLFP